MSELLFRSIQLDPPRLIRAVKKRPMLFDTESPEYFKNKGQKNKAWQEICREVVPNWDNLRPHERVECCHEIQRRWKSFRTCFRRELKAQCRENQRRKANLPIKRRKVYSYFRMLSFLLPSYKKAGMKIRPRLNSEEYNTELGEGGDNDNMADEEEDDDDDDDDPLEDSIKTERSFDGHSRNEAMILEDNPLQHLYETNQHEGNILEYVKEVKRDEEDEDKQFLMSLIPTFRKLSDKQRFEARIDILKVLKDISFRQEGGASSSTN